MVAGSSVWLVLPALLATAVHAEAGGNCALTVRPPVKARYLKFCQDYNALACCIPGHDLENQVQFENLIEGLGPGCKNPMMYPEVRFFYCLGCDPRQPEYTESVTLPGGDEGGTIKVCKSFLDKLWRDPAYDDCGVMYSNPCPGPDWDFDPYQCGDTLLLPRQHFNNNVTLFINTFKPPGLENYDFAMVDDTSDADGNVPTDCWMPHTYSSLSAGSGRVSAGSWVTALLVAGVTASLQLIR